jgi:3-keto-disaccharide hydrolase
MTRTMLAAFIAALAAAAPIGAADAPNTLTDKERADGWKLLFDGQTTAGWHGYKQKGMPEGWAVKDGALTRVAKTTDIVSDEEFANFELQFDWKIAKNGNSGLFFHVVESPKYKETYYTGPEFQLLDNAGHPDGKNGPDRWAGANYALHAPTQNTAHGPGEWNQCRLIVNNGHVEHWMNGAKVVEYELWSDDWKARVAKSKFTQWPDYGMAKSGRIALQEHGAEIAFRNLKIKVLPAKGTN